MSLSYNFKARLEIDVTWLQEYLDELTGNKCLQRELNLASVVCSRIGEVSRLPILPMHTQRDFFQYLSMTRMRKVREERQVVVSLQLAVG